jgi:hypothetical protein
LAALSFATVVLFLPRDAIQGVTLCPRCSGSRTDFLAVDFEGVDFFFAELAGSGLFGCLRKLLGVVFFGALKA